MPANNAVGPKVAPRSTWRDPWSAVILQGHQNGTLEAILAALLFGLVLAIEVPQATSTLQVGLILTLCVAAGIAGRWPIVGGVVVGSGLTALVAAPPAWFGVAVHAFFIPVLSVWSRPVAGWFRWLLTSWYLAALTIGSGMAAGFGSALVPYLMAWGFLLAVAALTGSMIRKLGEAKDAERLAALRQQRLAMARDLHDTVAHELSLVVLRLQSARLSGAVNDEDVEYALVACRNSISDLRGVLGMLRDESLGDIKPRSLSPGRFDDLLAERLAALDGLGFRVDTAISPLIGELGASVQDALSWALREATANVAKYGDPGRECSFVIDMDGQCVEMLVRNGISSSRPTGEQGGVGLVGMQERVQAAGGTVSAGEVEDRVWITQAKIPL